MTDRPRLLLYCQHSLGMGHLVRSLALAEGLAQRYHLVFLNVAQHPKRMKLPKGIEFISLPPLGFDSEMRLCSRDRRRNLEEAKALRGKMILDAFRALRPEIILIELFPFGRKKFAGELIPLLKEAHAANG